MVLLGDIKFWAFVVGLVVGAALLLAVAWVYVRHQKLGGGGAVLSLFGVILVGLSLWSSIEFSVSPEGGIEARLSKIEEKTENLDDKVDKQAGEVDAVRTQTQAVDHQLKRMDKAVNARVDNVDKSVKAIDEKVDRHAKALDVHAKSLTILQKRTNTLTESIKNARDFGAVKNKFKGIKPIDKFKFKPVR